ncbi:hypothetical protein DFH07DRAFT_915956 [Mycena maculata]|uniref:TRIP4/RQT4 C2HC5-type zinc finger domain-containing protein n=1 Tax=Mycena maculata TaxID=230809 RepID=A0AAD7JK82_9AGAR|nr:hypothetical protein DFH07DRAFT_915956 [Mycena maculata]
MPPHTPRTKTSSVPSDRIRPSPPPQTLATSAKNMKGKGKGAVKGSEPPKSKAVRQLESLKYELAVSYTSHKKDQKGGCFCQARDHPLSTYTALCRNCGLVLCAVNLPQYTCPHCASSLLSNVQRDALIARLDTQIADTLASEALLRERAAEEARRAAGAFPTLGPGPAAYPPSARAAPPALPQTRTVMSLNSKTKKVTVSSFTSTPSASPSRPSSRAESVDEETVRVAGPPAAVPFAAAATQDPLRPWRDLGGGGAVYVPAPNLDCDDDDGAKGAGKKRRQESREGEGK